MKLRFTIVFRLISQLGQLSSQLTAFLNLHQFLTGGTGVNTLGTLLLLLFGGTSKIHQGCAPCCAHSAHRHTTTR